MVFHKQWSPMARDKDSRSQGSYRGIGNQSRKPLQEGDDGGVTLETNRQPIGKSESSGSTTAAAAATTSSTSNNTTAASAATQTAASFCMPSSVAHFRSSSASSSNSSGNETRSKQLPSESLATIDERLSIQSTFNQQQQHQPLSPKSSVAGQVSSGGSGNIPNRLLNGAQVDSRTVSSISSEESGLGSTESDALLSGSRGATKQRNTTASLINIADSGVNRVNSTDDYDHKRRRRKRFD